MEVPIVTASQRKKEKRGVKGCIFGKSGIGKTSLLWTLNAETTLFIDVEAGDLAVEDWSGDSFRPRTWQQCRDLAVFVGGPNPALRDDQSYSQAHYNAVAEHYSQHINLDKYDTLFVDSITVAGRLCLQWCKGQPEGFSERTGKADTRGAYGLHGQEMIAWLTHLQHTRNKHVWLVGILDEKTDDYNRKVYEPQIDGSKTGLELPGIVDQVVTMSDVPNGQGQSVRTFINHTLNDFGFPAKDRSGRLSLYEEANLGKLMQKIQSPARPVGDRLEYSAPPSENPPVEQSA